MKTCGEFFDALEEQLTERGKAKSAPEDLEFMAGCDARTLSVTREVAANHGLN